jgi:alpha-amylase
MDNMINCATTFLLSPGIAQIFYGDETLRPLSDAKYNVDSDQAFRSDMNWDSINETVLQHYQKLGKIRKANPVIGTGKQRIIDTHTCVRYNNKDTLVIRVAANSGESINLGNAFPEGSTVTELYTGQTAIVTNGKVRFERIENKVAIIKQ